MLCQVCNQKEANVHFTQIINGVKTEKHLCEECSKINKNSAMGTAFNIGMPLSFQSILDGIFEVMEQPKQQVAENYTCPTCGMSFESFRKNGRVGCGNCYEIFNAQISPIIKRVHGNIQHTGKMPSRAGGKLKLKKEADGMKEELRVAIASEEYEKAAVLRDKIRELEAQIKNSNERQEE